MMVKLKAYTLSHCYEVVFNLNFRESLLQCFLLISAELIILAWSQVFAYKYVYDKLTHDHAQCSSAWPVLHSLRGAAMLFTITCNPHDGRADRPEQLVL